MQNLLWLCRRLWLPLFLLAGVSWLFAPWYYGDHYGTLHLVSSYEGGAKPLSWLFRTSDVISALLLVGSVWLFGIWRQERRLSWLLIATAVLAAIDAIFVDSCKLNSAACTGWQFAATSIHVGESILFGALIVLTAVYHAGKSRRQVSWWFVALQVAMGVLALSGMLSSQQIVVLEYAYELSIVCWLAWLVGQFIPAFRPSRAIVLLRRAFGWWALLNGAFAIVVAITHRELAGRLFDLSLSNQNTLVGQHGIVAGLLMLYLARHVYAGQRRAALVLLGLFGIEAIKYSVLTPSPILLTMNLLSFALLLYGRQAFDRNTLPLPFFGRMKDIGIVLTGVLLALLVSQIIATAAGHRGILQRGIRIFYSEPAKLTAREEDRYELKAGHRLHILAETALIGVIAVAAWSLFRPARSALRASGEEAKLAADLLHRFGRSSEDFFKLWPTDKTYFVTPAGDGLVAYKVVGSLAFALADPVAAEERRGAVLEEFLTHCRNHGWTACFLLVEEAHSALYADRLRLVKIGSSAVVTTEEFVTKTIRQKWWRWQRNRAEKLSLRYHSSEPPHASHLLRQLQGVSDAWLATGNHAEQGFALGYFDESYLQRCRLHILQDAQGAVVAFANELPVLRDTGQRTVDLIRYRPGNNGAMPYLLAKIIEQLRAEGIARFDLGFVPLAKLDTVVVRSLRRLAAARYSSLGLEQFKNKFDPTWQLNYLAYDGTVVDLALIATSLEQALKPPIH